MALEAMVFQEDPFSYGFNKDLHAPGGAETLNSGFGFEKNIAHTESLLQSGGFGFNANSEYSPLSSVMHSITKSSFPEYLPCGNCFTGELPPVEASPAAEIPSCRRKRRRTRNIKNKEEVENQRMTHIAVERNRRKQMNQYLSVLRSLMPPSYVQRGDQASIVGGAINYVKELEQLLQALEMHKRIQQQTDDHVHNAESNNFCSLFPGFFSFPQYSTSSAFKNNSLESVVAKKLSAIAEVEVTMAETHANLKVLSKSGYPKQLFKMVTDLLSLGLNILHLNVATFDHAVLYSFSVKKEEGCQLNSENEIAAAVYEMMGRVQEEAAFI